jgi:hypothetical protein
MDRPRLLLVPTLTEIEWVTKPLLEEWADVASYDAPGIGSEPAVDDFGPQAVARRGLAELDRLGWDDFVLVADEFALPAASLVVAAVGERLRGMALGHARLSNSSDGERPAVNAQVLDGIRTLMRTDPRSFVRQMFKMTVGEGMVGGYGDEMIDEYQRRVPFELGIPFYDSLDVDAEGMAQRFMSADVPMLLAKHEGCLLFTGESFDDMRAQLPEARSSSFIDKPSTSPEFAQVLREFCTSLATAQA